MANIWKTISDNHTPTTMDNFKLTIRKDRQRADKSFVVFIRYTHDRRTTYFPTTMVATKKDITSSYKIKNQQIIERGDDIIRSYRKRLEKLVLEINELSFEQIVEYLKKKDDSISIDFLKYANEWIELNKEKKGLKNYQTAVNALRKYVGRDILFCNEITLSFMHEWERSLEDRPRACSLYTSSIAKIFNDARDFYNDYENGEIRIKDTLHNYKAKKQKAAVKRALNVEQIRAIASLTDCEGESRFNLAKDCFILSFCLMGINAIDLYTLQDYDGERIIYNRTKTKDRRSDDALMVVDVPDFIKPLLEKYRHGAENGHVFNFSARFSTPTDFNRSLNIGLKKVGEKLNIPNLQFYAARHSMATIAANDVRIPIYIVNDMLCHIDERMRVTNLYIKKDFSLINEANAKLVDFVFSNKEPKG